MNKAGLRELRSALAGLVGNDSIEGVIIHGKDDFCSGCDVRELTRMSFNQSKEYSKLGQETFLLISRIDAPVVAAIDGAATGVGLELALACYARVATSNAVLGHFKKCLPPCFGGSVRLSKLIGPTATATVLRTERKLSAREAHNAGIVDSLVDRRTLIFEAEQLIRNETLPKMDVKLEDFFEEREAFARCLADAEVKKQLRKRA